MKKLDLARKLVKALREGLPSTYKSYLGGSLAAHFMHENVIVKDDSDIDIFILGSHVSIHNFIKQVIFQCAESVETFVEYPNIPVTGYELLPNQWYHRKFMIDGIKLDFIGLETQIQVLVSKTASDLGKIYLYHDTNINGLHPCIPSLEAYHHLLDKKVYFNPHQATTSHYDKVITRTDEMGYNLILVSDDGPEPSLSDLLYPTGKSRRKNIRYDDKEAI